MKLAPVILFVYNRPKHTEQTLEALMANELAKESVLFIYADGPKANSDKTQRMKISQTRLVIKKKNWCKVVHIIEREENLGLADSVINGVTEVMNLYDKAIVLEDDILTSSVFLNFMNDALDYYEKDVSVAGISGFKYPSKKEFNDVHFLPIGSSWGWATWKLKSIEINFDTEYLISEVKKRRLEKKLNFGGFRFFEMLINQSENLINSWAIRYYASFFLNNQCFVYPPKSLVKNIGFGLEGTHTIQADNYMDNVNIFNPNYNFREAKFDKYTSILRKSFKDKYVNKRSLFNKLKKIKSLSFLKKLLKKIKG